jgi:hypothetical protein
MVVAVLALVMAMVGTGIAATALSKKGKKQVNNIVTRRVMAATVNAGDTCTVSKQTGGISAALVGTSPGPTAFCDVTFPRTVDNCSVGATPLHPLQDISGMASIRYLGGATVRVTRVNGANNFQAAGLFTIIAVCPTT